MARLREQAPEGSFCHQCRPCLFPHQDRCVNEAHLAVRWGHMQFEVTLDGADISNQCTEAVAGPEGLVVLFLQDEKHVYQCPCQKGAAEVVMRGDVKIQTQKGEDDGRASN